MSSIYTWAGDMTADTTGQAQDYTLIFDTSTGLTKKATLSSVFLGQAPDRVIGFYGATGVVQPTFTATALTALGTAVMSAANTGTVYCFGNNTTAKAVHKRLAQIQVDLEVLMNRINSTGLLAISGA